MSGISGGLSYCPICLEHLPDFCPWPGLEGCSHRFCDFCLQQHVGASIEPARYPVRCPGIACSAALTHMECRKFAQAKFLDMLTELASEAAVSPHLRAYCPRPTCATFVPLKNASKGVKCPKCSHWFCSSCRVAWHYGKTCEEYKRQEEKDDMDRTMELAGVNGWRRCNSCGQLVERTGGCLHIKCRCGAQWCYACGSSWGECQSTCTRR